MIIAIDLGTTHSLVGVWQGRQVQLIPNSLGQHLTPSVVSIDEDGRVLVGESARERLRTHPERTAANFKRVIGTPRTFALATGHSYSAEELSALVLRSLKADAESYLGHAVRQAVITVPAYFNDVQRTATKAAAELAGLQVVRLLNEPTAAAMAYGLHQLDRDSKFLVLDLGGGTFDVTLLDLFAGVMEVRASAGDNFLGGEDFSRVLVDGFIDHHAKQGVETVEWQAYEPRLYAAAEQAKRELGSAPQARMAVVIKDIAYDWVLTEADFVGLSQRLLERCRLPIERAVRDAQLRVSELDDVVLVGGASRMTAFRKLAAQLLGRIPSVRMNPDETIARGAAIQAGLVAQDAALDEVILTDVAPFSLGVETSRAIGNNAYQDGLFEPIIERNTVIPASRVHTFRALHDTQREVEFVVYQGEARLVKDNIRLGGLSVELPRGVKARDVSIDVRFSYTVDGLLEVDVGVDGQHTHLVIENGATRLSAEQLTASLAKLEALKIHPRDQMENRTLLARAERMYQERLGHEREQLSIWMSQFEHVMDSQNPLQVREAAAQFRQRLEAMDQSWLS